MKNRLAVLAALAIVPVVAAQDPAPAPQAAPAAQAAPAPQAAPPKPATLGLIVYPGSGQDAAKQGLDENECYSWAHQQTGIDPTAPPTQAAAVEAPKGGAVKGAARGAAKGAAVGAISDERHIGDEGSLDAGEGAAAGAAVGAAKGRRAQKKAGKQAEAQAQQAAQAQDTQKKDTFKKAWGACLEGRGYSVK
jgi:YMGG-like Gly-zipper